jgi:hypothetical protein
MGCVGNTPICAAVAEDNGCSSTVMDFEDTVSITEAAAWGADPGIDLPSGLAGGTYAYSDGGTMAVTLETADSAGTGAQSFHYTQTAAVQWGGGFGFWFYCTDISAYEGVSFWAKGTLPEAATTAENPGIEIAFQNPATTSTDGCGNCEGTCRGARVYQTITADWAMYEYVWADIGPGNAGEATANSTFDPAEFHGINFHVPAAVGEDIDVSVDELALINDDPPPAEDCVTVGGSANGSGGTGTVGSGGSGTGGGAN